jgi:hypothetical protein
VVVAASDRIAQIGLDHVTDSIRIDPVLETREESRDTQVAETENVAAAHKPAPAWAAGTPAAPPKTAHTWRSYRPLAAALVITAVVAPLLLFGRPHAITPIGAKAVSESRSLIAARSKIDPLTAMEKVAIDLRRPAILALITPSPLRALPIAREERGARKIVQTAAKEEKISGKSAVVAGSGALAPIPVPLPKPASAARPRPETKTVTAAAQKSPALDNSKRVNVVQDKAPAPARAVPPPKNQPASSVAGRPPSVKVAEDGIDGAATLLSHDQVARLLRDLSQRVGFAPAEYSALQACVFGKVGQGSVEANVFRSLVRRCVL